MLRNKLWTSWDTLEQKKNSFLIEEDFCTERHRNSKEMFCTSRDKTVEKNGIFQPNKSLHWKQPFSMCVWKAEHSALLIHPSKDRVCLSLRPAGCVGFFQDDDSIWTSFSRVFTNTFSAHTPFSISDKHPAWRFHPFFSCSERTHRRRSLKQQRRLHERTKRRVASFGAAAGSSVYINIKQQSSSLWCGAGAMVLA